MIFRYLSHAGLSLCAIFSLVTLDTAASENTDTLFTAVSAKKITIQNTPEAITINAYEINGGTNNYFYSTSSSKKTKSKDTGRTVYDTNVNLRDIVVTEDSTEVCVKYVTDENEESEFSFPIPSPDNRIVKSYVGKRENDFGLSLPLRRTTTFSWHVMTGGAYFGWGCLTSSSSQCSLMGNIIEGGWLSLLGVEMRHAHNSLSLGVGLGMRHILADKGYYYTKDEKDHRIFLAPFEDNQEKRKSSIRLFTLHMPLLYNLHFGHGRNCDLHVGPILNFNTGGSFHTSYNTGDNSYHVTTHNINQRPVTVDAFFSIGWNSLNVYARYSPMTTFKPVTGIKFKPLSFGICVLL